LEVYHAFALLLNPAFVYGALRQPGGLRTGTAGDVHHCSTCDDDGDRYKDKRAAGVSRTNAYRTLDGDAYGDRDSQPAQRYADQHAYPGLGDCAGHQRRPGGG
jgi:hypothetical protein